MSRLLGRRENGGGTGTNTRCLSPGFDSLFREAFRSLIAPVASFPSEQFFDLGNLLLRQLFDLLFAN